MDYLKFFNIFPKEKKKGLPSSFQVGELVVHNLNPLGGMFKKGVTKAGRISLAGTLNNGKKVKVYESSNPNQIKLRKILGDQLKNEDILLPSLLAYDDNFIVEEWITGTSFSHIKPKFLNEYSEKFINFIDKIHYDVQFNEIADLHQDSFCYLSDYLIMRLKPWQNWSPVGTLLKAWQKSNLETEKLIKSRISHPDLSLSNIILSQDNRIFIVDNELIGSGKGWLLDERNSFFREKVSSPKFRTPTKNFFELSWKLRLVGSAIDQGDFYRAERMADLKRI